MKQNGKPEKISAELLAQLKSFNRKVHEAELELSARRSGLTMLYQHIAEEYDIAEDEQVEVSLADGTIKRAKAI